MTNKLIQTDQGLALLITPEMQRHLGVTEVVEVVLEPGEIRLRRPLTLEEAACLSDDRYAEAYRELASR